MGTVEQDNELTDVSLCYQSLGIPLGASPTEIEQVFKALTEEYKAKLASPDPAGREEASRNLEQLNEMYDKIRGSVTYRAMEKDHLKRIGNAPASEARVKRPVHRAVIEKTPMINCPRCNGVIAKSLKTCPICKSRLYTVTEKIMRAYFSPTKIVIYCLVLAVAASLVFFLNKSGDKTKGSASEIDSLEKLQPK